MEDEFYSRLSYLSLDAIWSLYDRYRIVELNNVFEGFNSDFFTIMFDEDASLEEYSFIYIGDYNGIKGLMFRSGRQIEDRDILTLRFAREIEAEFPELNSLITFNTFQSQLKKVYENFGVLCLPDFMLNQEGQVSVILTSRKNSIERILQIDILEFYRSFFNREEKIKDKKEQPKVYLMYDKKEGLVKIGETKQRLNKRKKGVAESTLRASDPMIEIITAWEAPKALESELHSKFNSKRVRGEWFDIRPIDLKDIDKQTLSYKMIHIK